MEAMAMLMVDTCTLSIFSTVHSTAPTSRGRGRGQWKALASRKLGGQGAHHLSGQPEGWHVSLASTSFVEGWRVPTSLPRVWAQWWGRGQDWGMKGVGH